MYEEDVIRELEKLGYKFEFVYGTYDYDWHRVHVYTRDRRVFALAQNGCSCNYFGDRWTTAFDAEGDLTEVLELPALDSWWSDTIEPDIHTIRKKLYDLGVR